MFSLTITNEYLYPLDKWQSMWEVNLFWEVEKIRIDDHSRGRSRTGSPWQRNSKEKAEIQE
jgi:hypothetical protein